LFRIATAISLLSIDQKIGLALNFFATENEHKKERKCYQEALC